MTKIIFSFFYILIAAIVFLYARKAENNPQKLGRYMKRNLYLSCGVILAYSITLMSNHYFIMSIGHTGVSLLTNWLIFYSLEFVYLFTKQKKDYSIIKKILIIFLVVDSLSLLINPFHEIALFYEIVYCKQDAFLVKYPLPSYYIHWTLCYLMFLFILYLLIGKMYRIPKAFCTKYLIIICSVIAVAVVHCAFYFTGRLMDGSIIFQGLICCLIYFISFDFKPAFLLNNTREIIVEEMNNPVVLFDFEGLFVTCNPQAKKIFSLTETEEGEKTMKSFMEENNFNDMIKIPKRSRFDARIEKNGREYWFDVNYTNLSDNKAKYLGGLFVFTDITEQKKIHFELEYLADHDSLTGCYNRNYFLKIINSYDKMINLGIVLWNVNGLKLINNFYGKTMGDKAICILSEYVKAGLRPKDILMRLEGEGLLILMPDIYEKEMEERMLDIRNSIHDDKNNELKISAEYSGVIKETEEKKIEACLIQARNVMQQKKILNDKNIRDSIIGALKKSLIESDYETEEHAERTKEMAVKLGGKLGLTEEEKKELSLLSLLHDIGKIAIPDLILSKPEKLSETEWEIMKTHTSKGFEIAQITSEMETIARYILYHHEKWDGTGYPSNLKGEEIPLLSRILTVVESYDVMTHNKAYNKMMSREEAKEELIQCAGSQFDPKIVKVFLELLEEEEKTGVEESK